MACVIISSRPLAANANRRPRAFEQACSTSQPACAIAARRATLPHLHAAPREQRQLLQQRPPARLRPRSIPVSGPGAPGAPGASGGVAGQVTAELMNSMRAKICEALETDTCSVTDVYGDGRHVSIDVVSTLFADKNSMQRQRMVYKAIWMELQEAVHAVDSMNTKTPDEAAAAAK